MVEGAWTGVQQDDFQLRNGTVLNYTDLVVTENPEILNGTLSEMLLYPFGQSCELNCSRMFNCNSKCALYLFKV